MKAVLRQKVLKAAKELFLEKGFEAVGIREIAQAVGLQPTQLYRLKLSKTDILAEVIITLNEEQIQGLPDMLATVEGADVFERTCAYLLALYRFDVHYQSLRSVGAMYGWLWTGAHEAAVIAQVRQLLAPIARWMQDGAFDDIPARCYGIWSLYYVGYRCAVIHGASADACLAEIQPSLKILLRPSAAPCP